MTLEECKQLKDSLNELFENRNIWIDRRPDIIEYPLNPMFPTGPGDFPFPQTWCCAGDTWTLKIS